MSLKQKKLEEEFNKIFNMFSAGYEYPSTFEDAANNLAEAIYNYFKETEIPISEDSLNKVKDEFVKNLIDQHDEKSIIDFEKLIYDYAQKVKYNIDKKYNVQVTDKELKLDDFFKKTISTEPEVKEFIEEFSKRIDSWFKNNTYKKDKTKLNWS